MNIIFLQAAPAAGNSSPFWSMPLFMGAIFLVMYFFMIRPQQKKQKAEESFRASLKAGDKVMSIGGIYGTVVSIEDNIVLVEVDKGTKLRFDKTAIRPDTAAPQPM